MKRIEKIKKLQTLPWYALHNIAIKKGIDENEVNNKDKNHIIDTILSYDILTEDDIEQYVNDYIYGDRVTFTLWTFQTILQEKDYEVVLRLEQYMEEKLTIKGYRKLQIISIKEFEKRIEIVYVYSKEYFYINENGQYDGIWEQHRGCLWIGKSQTYLACISKHEKMTAYIVNVIAEKIGNTITQVKPPKCAIDKCTNFKAISRIVLQGKDGEKTVVSRAGGITTEQEEEIQRIREQRIDTSGSFISEITEKIDATVKYNVRTGSIGIYKHLPASVLFTWTENAINTIINEINELRGIPAEEIFKEVGQEIKWSGLLDSESYSMNWYLTQVINAIDKDEFDVQIPNDKLSILQDEKLFISIPRIYCRTCDSYEIPYCKNCGRELKINRNTINACSCGAPLEITCSDGHDKCEIIYWYVPKPNLISKINYNIRKVFKDVELDYSICILGDKLYIANNTNEIESDVEIPFTAIECFNHEKGNTQPRLIEYAVNMNEKCGGTCSYEKIQQCISDKTMACLPKVFYSILPSFYLQPHKGMEYGDVSGPVKAGGKTYEMKGIIKKNSENKTNKSVDYDKKIRKPLLSSSKEGQEIIRQFVEQGMIDARCQLIAVIIPQHIDASFKGTLRHLARLSGKKVAFIELNEIAELLSINKTIDV